jgi:hypothetical protein
VVLTDGGEPSAGLARVLAPDDWERVVRKYFLLDRGVVDEHLDASAEIRNGSEL